MITKSWEWCKFFYLWDEEGKKNCGNCVEWCLESSTCTSVTKIKEAYCVK